MAYVRHTAVPLPESVIESWKPWWYHSPANGPTFTGRGGAGEEAVSGGAVVTGRVVDSGMEDEAVVEVDVVKEAWLVSA